MNMEVLTRRIVNEKNPLHMGSNKAELNLGRERIRLAVTTMDYTHCNFRDLKALTKTVKPLSDQRRPCAQSAYAVNPARSGSCTTQATIKGGTATS